MTQYITVLEKKYRKSFYYFISSKKGKRTIREFYRNRFPLLCGVIDKLNRDD